MIDWLFHRFFNEKRVDYLTQKALNVALDLMQTPEFQKEIYSIIDPVFDNYKTKVMGSIGGLAKGFNVAQGVNSPGFEIVDKRGNIQLSKVIASFVLGAFNKPQDQNTNKSALP